MIAAIGSCTVRHPIFARLYARMSDKAEQRGQVEHRATLLAGLEGRVVEVGAGNGLNFDHYPSTVTEVVAVEPEEYLRGRAREAAKQASVPIRIVDGVAEGLPLEDESFDAAVISLVLCSVHDQRQALAEIRRVLRPKGQLRFYEHVVSTRPMFAALQRAADATVYPKVSGGCHLARDTAGAIERAGFATESLERFPFTPLPMPPGISHILGAARRL